MPYWHAATGALQARGHFRGGGLHAKENLRRGKQFPASCCGYLLGPTKMIMSSCVVTPSGHEELMRVNDRRRFYANLSPVATTCCWTSTLDGNLLFVCACIVPCRGSIRCATGAPGQLASKYLICKYCVQNRFFSTCIVPLRKTSSIG